MEDDQLEDDRPIIVIISKHSTSLYITYNWIQASIIIGTSNKSCLICNKSCNWIRMSLDYGNKSCSGIIYELDLKLTVT